MRTQCVSLIGCILLLVACAGVWAVESSAVCRCGFDPAIHRRFGLSAMNRGVNDLGGGEVGRWVNVNGVFPNPPDQKTVVTYSIVIAANETYSGKTLEPIVDADFIGAESLAAIQEGIESWNDTAGITLRRVASGGQIRIGAASFPGSQVGLGGFSAASTGGAFFMDSGFVQLDKTDGTWTRNDLRATTAHEAGHALGLNHTDSASALMFPSGNSSIGPVPDDRWYMQFLYGSARAKLSTAAAQTTQVILTIGRAAPKQTGTNSTDTADGSAAAPNGPGKGTGSVTQNDVTQYIVERMGPSAGAFVAVNSNVTAASGGQNADPALTHAANEFNFVDSTLATSGVYQYRVRAVHAVAGNDTFSDTASVTVTVNGGATAPSITSALSATATVGTPFTYAITASNSPTSFGATGLPPGLSVNAAGVISGTPTAAGSTTISLSATNATGPGTATLVLTITAPSASAPVISSALNISVVLGAVINYSITASNSPTSFAAAGLPAGLNVDATTGVIAGMPAAAGVSNVTLTATNAAGFGNATLTITITAPAAALPAITSALSASGMKGLAFTYTITASGDAPMTFVATVLPAGLSLTGATISGTPAVSGGFAVLLTASNAAGSASASLALNIAKSEANTAPVFTTPPTAPPVSQVGMPVTLTAPGLTDDDDALGYLWDFGDGSTLVAGPTVTHIYSTPGIFKAKVTVSDGTDSTVSSEINVAINGDAPELATLAGKLPNVFAVLKARIVFNFKTPVGKDTLSVSGTLPLPKDFVPSGKSVQVLFGGLDLSMNLDPKGKATNKAFSVKAKLKNGTFLASPSKFTLTLKKATLFADFEELGFSDDDVLKPGETIDARVVISLDGFSYEKTISFNYTAKIGKKGTATKP